MNAHHPSSRPCRLIVLTGGPGAGKTAVLEVIRRNFPARVAILQEAASILFSGGFPRGTELHMRRSAQRAIFHVQRELEAIAMEQGVCGAALCDRGSLDGIAYWPGDAQNYLDSFGTTKQAEFARYHAVIHLRTPADGEGYDNSNPVRVETSEEAAHIDAKIAEAWEGHPRCFTVESTLDFLDKVVRVVTILNAELLVPPGPTELTGVAKQG